MEEKIRFLCIAPYENMSAVMKSAAEEFPIELTVYVGDLEAGLEIALKGFHNNYDAVISRGGTAAMLRKKLSLPVVEIPVTMAEIMRVVRLTGNMGKPYAIMGHPNIIEQAKNIESLMQIPMVTLPVQGEQEARQRLEQLEDQKYTLLCDMVAYRMAQEMKRNAILITSDPSSIRAAFQEALRICENGYRLREENRFLRRLVWNQVHNTVVYTQQGELFFSTVPDNSSPILNFLQEESLRHQETQEHYLKQINNVLYHIRKHHENLGEQEYTTFYFSESRVTTPDVRRGIRFLTRVEAEENFEKSFYSVTNIIRDLQPQIRQINTSDQPLMVCGEDGTCKEQVVCYLYFTSRWQKYPLIIVDCFLLNEKSWNFLMNHHNSPLAKSECTIFLNDVDVLPPLWRHQLVASLVTMEVCKRNRVIVSCICGKNQRISDSGMNFMEQLECLNLFLPPLRQRSAQMAELAAYYLNHLNTRIEEQTYGLENAALHSLQSYDWPHNYAQFKRVMRDLALACPGRSITEQDVSEILVREKNMTSTEKYVEGRDVPLDLRMTLEELDKEIVRRVLEEEHGNQSATARRLGIGRTTLWRLLNNG